ncbi:MAG: hypothetical protein WC693_01715 [Patescibacteria group bacterium]
MTSDSSESRSEGIRGLENSTEPVNGSDSRLLEKPEQDYIQADQYVLADTGCGMVFLKKDQGVVPPI